MAQLTPFYGKDFWLELTLFTSFVVCNRRLFDIYLTFRPFRLRK